MKANAMFTKVVMKESALKISSSYSWLATASQALRFIRVSLNIIVTSCSHWFASYAQEEMMRFMKGGVLVLCDSTRVARIDGC